MHPNATFTWEMWRLGAAGEETPFPKAQSTKYNEEKGMKYDNPAGRLLEVLIQVRKFPLTAEARLVWTTVFDLPKNDLTPLLTATLGKIMLLPYEAVSMLAEEHPELTDPFPTWALQVSAAFQVHNVHSTIDTFSKNITDDTLANIRTTAVLLDKGSKR